MAEQRIGIIMNGVTGRMGYNQHLVRSILAIRAEGGLALASGDRLMPDPILVGRDADKLASMARRHGLERWTTDLEGALANRDDTVFFDAGTTQMRAALIGKAIDAGKHVYCEKPVADDLRSAVALARKAKASGLRHGVVQDKLFLPGLLKLKLLIDSGFFGRILSVRGEFGYWVFEGDWGVSAQRPSWNYRKADGGGIILDMLCHWRYVLDNLFGEVKAVSCLGATHIPSRVAEDGKAYAADADDAAYATFELGGGVIAQINSSWATRVRRDDLVTFHVDGTLGSAVAGLHKCFIQPRAGTPKPVWNPDVPQPIDFFDSWQEMPDTRIFDNGFKTQWEMFLRHVAEDAPWAYGLEAGAKGVQLATLGLQSWKERRWVDVPALGLQLVAARVLSMNLATTRGAWSFAEAVDGCLRHGITAISPWRDQVAAIGLDEAARIVRANGLRVTGLCRGGMFTADTAAGRQAAIDDNRRAIDEAAVLGADCLVLVVGGLPAADKNIGNARKMVADGLAAILPHARAARMPLAIEPLHPMYAADRACVNTLDQALDLCEALGEGVGIAIDVYHVWWDPRLPAAIARAGRMRCILAHHICDWLVPTTDLLLDRGMMGDGIIDLRAIRAMIEAAGYDGPQEVEIFSRDNWWKRPGDAVLKTVIERFNTIC